MKPAFSHARMMRLKRRVGLELLEQRVMVDVIEAPFEIGIQDIFCLFVDLYVDGSDSIMT